MLLVFLIILSGAFSGSEIALTSLSRAKVRAIKEDKKFASSAIVKLKNKPEKLLITVLIGNNLVNILTTVMATVWGMRTFGSHAIGIVTGALTFIILVFGEITPKTLAQKFAEPFARIMAYPLLCLTYILLPIVWFFEKYIHGLMHALKAQHPIRSMSEEELLAMVDISTEEGVIEEVEQEMIENVLEFTDTTAEEVMTITKDIEAMEIATSIEDAVKFFLEHSHSRIPVYKDDLNNIIGIIRVHEILLILHDPQKKVKNLAEVKYSPLVVVPKTKSISKLFREFQRRRKHMAIVVDERGQTVGLVTLEDILEEIVGDIVDEQDRETKMVRMIDKNTWEAEGEATIEEINETLNLELDYPEHQTIGLLILEELQRFPNQGEKIPYENLILQVKDMSKKKIEKVAITKLSKDEED